MLPTTSKMKTPKLVYEIFSDSFYWEDEGMQECPYKKVEIMKSVLIYRTYLLINQNPENVSKELKFYRYIFYRIKKRAPNWIGFREERCSYNPEIADRIKRIRKVSEWKMEKIFNESE